MAQRVYLVLSQEGWSENKTSVSVRHLIQRLSLHAYS